MAESSVGDFLANFAFNLRGVALVEGAVQAVDRLNAAVARREKVQDAITTLYGDQNKAAALIGLTYKDAEVKELAATSRAERWGKVMLAVNQTLEVGLKLYRGVQAGINAVAGAVQSVTDQASTAVDVGQRLGMSASAVQELGYTASMSSSSVEGMTLALTGLSNKLDAAKKGSKDAAVSLKAVGLDKTAAGQPLDVTLGRIADRFAAMPDGAKKSALAMDLFGKSGSKLIPLLNSGSAGIAALREEARATGYVIDDQAAGALEGFGDQTDKLKAQLTGLRNQAIVALLPALQRMVTGLQDWIAANRQLLVDVLTSTLRVFLGVLRVVGAVVEGVVATFAFLARNTDIVIAALAGLTAAMLPLIIEWGVMAAAAIAAAVATAAAWLVAAAPAILVGLAVAALVLVILRFRKQAVAAIEWVAEKWLGFGRLVWRVAKAYVGFWVDAARAVKDVFVGIFNGVEAAVRYVMRKFDEIVARAKGIGKEIGKKGILGAITDAVGIPGLSDIPGGGVAKSILKRTPGVGMMFGGNPLGLAGEAGAAIYGRVTGGGGPTLPTVPVAPASNKTVTQTNHVTVSAPNADAKQVVDMINDQLDMRLREAAAAIP